MRTEKRFTWLFLGLVIVLSAAASADLRDRLKEKIPESKRVLLPVSEKDEIRVGKQVTANMLGVAPLVSDDGLQRYVNTVGRWVASQSERPDLPWHFGVIESADVNAFAGPGGYVLVTRGLYARLSNESELAGVLAHEVAHVVKRHHIDLMRKALLIAEGGRLLEKKLSEDKNALVRNLVGNGAEMFARRLDQDAEFEADRMAVVLATRAGYDPYGLPGVLQKIGGIARMDDRVALLFKTHPLPDARLRKLDAAMGIAFLGYDRARVGGELYRLR